MHLLLPGWLSRILRHSLTLLSLLTLAPIVALAQDEMPDDERTVRHATPLADDAPVTYDADTMALVLARRYLAGAGNADSRAAVHDALGRMGWDVRNHAGTITLPAPAGTATGLAMRDYELEELLWKPTEQPAIRLISYAQVLAVPFGDADPEEIAQDLVDVLRKSSNSKNPQQRFWARFIIALGRVSPAGYDLSELAQPPVMYPSKAQLKALEKQAAKNPLAAMAAMNAAQPKPVWDEKDPILAASPLPEREENDPRGTIQTRDEKRLKELNKELSQLTTKLGTATDPVAQKSLQEDLNRLMSEMGSISNHMTAATTLSMAASMQKRQKARSGNSNNEEEDDEDDDDDENDSSDPRFIAEWRDQPLSLLQVSLLTRVIAADLRLYAKRAPSAKSRARVGVLSNGPLPFAMINLAQLAPAPAPNFGEQFSGAGGDIWATATGAYTGAVLEHHLPENKFSQAAGIANAMIAWFKTIMSVVRQNINVEVDNAPLIRTKNRSPGQQRTAKATVAIDFPKHDALKALRAAVNLTTIDLQLPDGGPVSGAKVVWRLTEGSYNNKYQAGKDSWEYKPELAVVQFAQAGSKDAYVSTTDSKGVATITIEGVPQKTILSPTVRPYSRRAAISVEVTIKVGNMTQDINDAINTAMGGPVGGGISFFADMVLRTSFFFQKGRVFEVVDWKEPLWTGEFDITVKASGSKTEKSEKGGSPVTYTWRMNRYMEGRLHTPDFAEDEENSRPKARTHNDADHRLEIDGDKRYFTLDDSSSAKSRTIDNRYEASGPVQIQPPGYNQLAKYSRAEPSGDASLRFLGGKMILKLRPFFGADCIVGNYEKNGRRASSHAGTRYLSLLSDISDEFTIIEENDGGADSYQGTKTFDYFTASLPYVPSFKVDVTINYRIWKNNPPPKNKPL
jgi:hypothetical protein